MNNNQISEILQELKKPFHPSQVVWKPGSLNQERTRALALAYADLRAYQNRLDELCGLDWSVSYTPWGERIVCHLTINGITRSSTGEPDSQSERSEIAGTAAEAQAFKRACAMFGLGRYLYNLPTLWVEYDPQSRSFTERARARLDMIVNQHYRRTLEAANPAEAEVESPAAESGAENAAAADENRQDDTTAAQTAHQEGEVATLANETNGVAHHEPAATSDSSAVLLRQQFDELGSELYGEQWSHVSRHNVERISAGQTNDSGQLTSEQMQKLVDGLKSLKRKRQRTLPANAATKAAVSTPERTQAALAF